MDDKAKNQPDQDNLGYENTTERNNQDDRENDRLETTETGNYEGPREHEDDTAGLRSESGKKSLGRETGNNEVGE